MLPAGKAVGELRDQVAAPAGLPQPAGDRIGTEEVENSPTDEFDERVGALDRDADQEQLVKAVLEHGAPNAGALDSGPPNSYLQLIPIHRLPGGAFVRASVFRLVGDFLATRWGGWRPVELKKGREWLVLPG